MNHLLTLLAVIGLMGCSKYTYNVGCNKWWGTTFEMRIEQQREVTYFYAEKTEYYKKGTTLLDILRALNYYFDFKKELKIYKNMLDIYGDILESGDSTPINHLSFSKQ